MDKMSQKPVLMYVIFILIPNFMTIFYTLTKKHPIQLSGQFIYFWIINVLHVLSRNNGTKIAQNYTFSNQLI